MSKVIRLNQDNTDLLLQCEALVKQRTQVSRVRQGALFAEALTLLLHKEQRLNPYTRKLHSPRPELSIEGTQIVSSNVPDFDLQTFKNEEGLQVLLTANGQHFRLVKNNLTQYSTLCELVSQYDHTLPSRRVTLKEAQSDSPLFAGLTVLLQRMQALPF